jgi:hypothetical protein
MYERFLLCPDLKPGEKCFRAQRYEDGEVGEEFHEHVPAHRISLDSEMETLRALVSQFEGWNGLFNLHSRLNNRRGGPEKYPGFNCHVTYPEEGTIRRYVSSTDVTAWSDYVIRPEVFRVVRV